MLKNKILLNNLRNDCVISNFFILFENEYLLITDRYKAYFLYYLTILFFIFLFSFCYAIDVTQL